MSGSFQSFLQLSGEDWGRRTCGDWRPGQQQQSFFVFQGASKKTLRRQGLSSLSSNVLDLVKGKSSYYLLSPTTTFFLRSLAPLLYCMRGCAKSFLVLLFGMIEAVSAKAPHKNVTPFLHCRMGKVVYSCKWGGHLAWDTCQGRGQQWHFSTHFTTTVVLQIS